MYVLLRNHTSMAITTIPQINAVIKNSSKMTLLSPITRGLKQMLRDCENWPVEVKPSVGGGKRPRDNLYEKIIQDFLLHLMK